jgi:hypothetical protein
MLRTKTAEEVTSKFRHMANLVKARGFVIQRLWCDNGSEYNNSMSYAELAERGITYEPSPPNIQYKMVFRNA